MRDRKKQKYALAVAAVMTITSVISPVVSVYAQEIDTTAIPQTQTIGTNEIADAGNVEINAENFPDEEFGKYVQDNFDNGDGVLTPDEISKVIEIDLSGKASIADLKGIECFTALESLICNSVGISTLDVSHNQNLRGLRCSGTGISVLDVSQNPALEYLYCSENRISDLDVSKNPALNYLFCGEEGVKSLDVSQNPVLEYLYCRGAGISALDVSRNLALKALDCHNTEISSLDVSNNSALEYLECSNTPLAWLNIGENDKLGHLSEFDSAVSLNVIGDTFNIEEQFKGIDLEKMTIKEGGSLDKETGIVSGYTRGTPIRYTYDCGIAKDGPVALNVTLNVEGIVINDVNFPDEGFRKYVQDKFDDGDNILMPDEISRVTEIDLSEKSSIVSVKGMEYFTALERLNCNGTRISDLDVSQNLNLEYLNCNSVGISDLDVSQNLNLEYLDCNGSRISSLDVSQNPALKSLSCSVDQISDLDVSQNPVLESLNCSGTQISSLDVSQNPNLKYLICNGTGISDLDMSQNPALESLDCNGTKIRGLDMSLNLSLKSLNCSYSKISDLNVSQNTALESLNCSGTQISSFNVSQSLALKNLKCSETQISALDVSQNLVLKTLDCSFTDISTLDVSKNSVLTSLNCSYTSLAWLNVGKNDNLRIEMESNLPLGLNVKEDTFNIKDKFKDIDLEKITIQEGGSLDKETGIVSGYTLDKAIRYTYDCGIAKKGPVVLSVVLNVKDVDINAENFPDEEFRKYIQKNFDDGDNLLTMNEIGRVIEIDVNENSAIADLKGIECFTELESLSCGGTGISALDVSHNPDLESLYCGETGIRDLDVSQNRALKSLICGGTGISTLDVSQNPALNYLDCSRIGISTLNVSQNPDLEFLLCGETGINVLDVSQNLVLKSLDCSGTGISVLDVSQNPALEGLYCDGIKISALDVSHNPVLKYLYCSDISLAWLNVGKNDNLGIAFESNSALSLNVAGDTFNIKEQFKGIDPEKITVKEGGSLDKKTGIVSGYVPGTPVRYTYDCGTAKDGPVTLNVTLTLSKSEGTVENTGNMDGEYTPDTGKTREEAEEKAKGTGSPKTGDSANAGLSAFMTLLSAGCIVFFIGNKRKKKAKK